MKNEQQTVRIFISSPGDVVQERDQARRVIEGLHRQYPRVTLQPILWEELALPATASFQQTIDILLERQPIDIAVFILWSRLGTPLGPTITRKDGTAYHSGTEREFELMLAAFEQSGRKRPVILGYARDDDSGFKQRLTESPSSELEDLIAQRKLAEAFIREQFYDAEGRNVRAVQVYREPIGFAQRLRVHLRQALDDLLEANAAPRWLEEPYRGLETFDVSHANIFFGRDEETCDVLQRLRDQDRAGRAFVVIVGASGSGKSSLARAGVAAGLLQQSGEDGVKEWRVACSVPGIGEHDLCTGLAKSLGDTLPELLNSGTAVEDIAGGLARDASMTVRLSIAPAFARADEQTSGTVRVLLVLDQLEELWTDRHVTSEERDHFLAAIEVLSQSGRIAVLATLRSDFYPHAQRLSAFLRLKGERGHYDLLPPSAASLQRLITEPARMAGLQFEHDEQTGRMLNETILQDAGRDPAALPLLQYALSELYRRRDESRKLLTFSAYQRMEGVEGALGKLAEDTFQSLPGEVQATLTEILPLLITVDVAGEQVAVRRRALVADLSTESNRRILTERLIAARFLTADRESGVPVASLAHEALLQRWKRIAIWVTENREHLRMRARVEQSQQLWEQQGRDDTLLLPKGLPLEEGRQLLSRSSSLLDISTTNYIQTSIAHHEAHAARLRKTRQVVMTAVCFLAAIALIAGGIASLKWREANRRAVEARVEKERAENQLLRSEWLLYASQIASALSAWETNDPGLAWQHLNACRADFRGWEHHYLYTLFNQNQRTFKGHSVAVWAASLSPDGKQIVSGSMDGSLKVWDVTSGREVLAFKGHDGSVSSVAFSPDGRRIVSGSSDKTLTLWDSTNGRNVRTFKGHTDGILSVAFSPNGKRIVSGSEDSTLRLWDADSDKETVVLKGHGGDVLSVAFRPDGKQVVSGSEDNTVKVWDVTDNRKTSTLTGHTGPVRSVAFSPDGKRIVSGSQDKTLKIWDATSRQESLTLRGHTDCVMGVAFSPDGKQVASGSFDNTIKLWDATSGQESVTFKGHTDALQTVVFSPDGSQIVSASTDRTVKVWDITRCQEPAMLMGEGLVKGVVFRPNGMRIMTGGRNGTLSLWNEASSLEPRILKGHNGNVRCVAFSPDGTQIVSGSGDNTLKLWDVTSGREIFTLKGHRDAVMSVAFSPDGKRIASGSEDKSLKLWDTTSGREILTLEGHRDGVTSVAFSPDGKRIVSGSVDNTLKLWDAKSGRETVTLEGHNGSVMSVAFSPDGKRIASGSFDYTLILWDATSGQEMLTLKGHDGAVCCLDFSPDGKRIASGAWDNTIRLWEVTTGQETLALKGHTGLVESVAFSPDGKRILSNSLDHTLKVWDATSTQETIVLHGHTDWANSVAFSPDGTQIVSGSGDNTLKLWDVTSGREIFTLKGHRDAVMSVAFSPDGKRIASGSEDKSLKLWDTTSGREILTLEGHRDVVTSVAFSPDGKRIISASKDETLIVWDAKSGRETVTLKGHNGPVWSVAFSPDGKRIVSGHGYNILKLWDVSTGRRMLTFKGHKGPVWSAKFSPDGKKIVSGSGDKTVKVWDATNGQELFTHVGHNETVWSVAFSPDGERIVSGGFDNSVKVWNAAGDQEPLTLRGPGGVVLDVAFSPDGKQIVSGHGDVSRTKAANMKRTPSVIVWRL